MIEIKIPSVGESVAEVEIGSWLKNEGDAVAKDENVVVLESDKATLELPAPEAGVLERIDKHAGEKASVGETIGAIAPGNAQSAKRAQENGERIPAIDDRQREATQAPKQHGAGAVGKKPEATGNAQQGATRSAEPAIASSAEGGSGGRQQNNRPSSSAEQSFSPEIKSGSHENGRGESARPAVQSRIRPIIVGAKLPDTAEETPMKGEPARRELKESSAEESASVTAPTPAGVTFKDRRQEKIVPLSPLRRAVAKRLVQAQNDAALLTTFNEIDMSAVKALRAAEGEQFQESHGVRLGFMSFFVKAAVGALKLVPQLNAELRQAALVYRDYIDVGIAVGSGKGLVVPVLLDAQTMTFAAIEKAIADFARRAEANQLKPADLEGGTFTISNGGIYGSLLSTPIINPPQSGILGMHAIVDRPVAHEGAVVIRPMMYVALTYDHRVIDGREAVTFLRHVKESIENPIRLLLNN